MRVLVVLACGAAVSSGTSGPTVGPTLRPTARPTAEPAAAPTLSPSLSPSSPGPTSSPSQPPSSAPTSGPLRIPTSAPSIGPATVSGPTSSPSQPPSSPAPTGSPTAVVSPPATTPPKSADQLRWVQCGCGGRSCDYVCSQAGAVCQEGHWPKNKKEFEVVAAEGNVFCKTISEDPSSFSPRVKTASGECLWVGAPDQSCSASPHTDVYRICPCVPGAAPPPAGTTRSPQALAFISPTGVCPSQYPFAMNLFTQCCSPKCYHEWRCGQQGCNQRCSSGNGLCVTQADAAAGWNYDDDDGVPRLHSNGHEFSRVTLGFLLWGGACLAGGAFIIYRRRQQRMRGLQMATLAEPPGPMYAAYPASSGYPMAVPQGGYGGAPGYPGGSPGYPGAEMSAYGQPSAAPSVYGCAPTYPGTEVNPGAMGLPPAGRGSV